jgi:hypothetical protein
MEYALACLREAEKRRREKPSVSTVPRPACGTDYGEAGQVITNAMGHMDEALSVGQRGRAVHAYIALQAGVASVASYMLAAGYFDPAPLPVAEGILPIVLPLSTPSMSAALDRAISEESEA